MQLLNTWKVITIGDGDLSFSRALVKRWPGIEICATVLDSQQVVREKYPLNAIDELEKGGHRVLFEVDITQPGSFADQLKRVFDVAIFQFPLVPNGGKRRPGQSWHQGVDSNLLNRRLLHAFLLNSAQFLHSEQGPALCYITSKDVKPYCDWNITCLGEPGPLKYKGQTLFNPGDFPAYRIRNVDRDKQVKSTAAITYVWTGKPEAVPQLNLQPPPRVSQEYCGLCDAGPILTILDWQHHRNSKLHRRRFDYQQRWERFLEAQNKPYLRS